MRKKQMMTLVLIAIALMGCTGKKAEENDAPKAFNVETISDGTTDRENKGREAEDNRKADANTANSAVADGETTDSGTTDGNPADSVVGDANTADNSIEDGNKIGVQSDDATQMDGRITAFGDKSTMDNNVGGRELPIYCVDTEENKVALSFDAAWGAEDTEEILDILKKHDIHVTFFATGGWVESYPDDVKAVLDAGHDLGNHSENHKNMSKLSDSEKEEELMAVHRRVKELTGYDMFLFRPPYGDYDNNVINIAKDCEYYAIQWDVDSLDWKNYGVDSIIETVTEHKNLGNGSIILCHNGAEYTAEALDELINKLEGQGYEIVPVSELIYQDNYRMNYEGRQIHGN